MMHERLSRKPSIRLMALACAALWGASALPAGAQLASAEARPPVPIAELEMSPEGWVQMAHGVWRLESADGTIRQYYATGPEGMAWARRHMEERSQELERAFLAEEGPTWDQIIEYRQFVEAAVTGGAGGQPTLQTRSSCSPWLRRVTASAGPLSWTKGVTAFANADWSSDSCTGCAGAYAYAQANGAAISDWCPTNYPHGSLECGLDAVCDASATKTGSSNCYSFAEAIVTSPVGDEYHAVNNSLCACSESVQCPGGGSVSCTGPEGTCSKGSDWVECGGERTYCPCTVSVQCPDGGSISCQGSQGTCSSGSDWVECDGNRTYCELECTGNGDPCVTSADCDCSCGPPEPMCFNNECECFE